MKPSKVFEGQQILNEHIKYKKVYTLYKIVFKMNRY